MKKLCLLMMFVAVATTHAVWYPLDTIRVVMYGDDYTDVITQSEVSRLWLDGKTKRTLQELVSERLFYHDAEKFKITADDAMVDKYLESLQRDNNMTLEQLKQTFRAAGFTFEEGKLQFNMILTVNNLLDYKIRSRLIVPEREVTAYCLDHPEYVEAEYELTYTEIPFQPGRTVDELRAEIVEVLAGKRDGTLAWQEPFWVKEPEIAPEKSFILTMQQFDVSEPILTDRGFELFRLIDKREHRLRTVEERYKEVVEILRSPRYNFMIDEYQQSLLSTVTVVNLDAATEAK